jgi:hypothetical protein
MVQVTRSYYTNKRGESIVVEATHDGNSYYVTDGSGHATQYGGPGAHDNIGHDFGIDVEHWDNQVKADSALPHSREFESSGTHDSDNHTSREETQSGSHQTESGGSHTEQIESDDDCRRGPRRSTAQRHAWRGPHQQARAC